MIEKGIKLKNSFQAHFLRVNDLKYITPHFYAILIHNKSYIYFTHKYGHNVHIALCLPFLLSIIYCRHLCLSERKTYCILYLGCIIFCRNTLCYFTHSNMGWHLSGFKFFIIKICIHILMSFQCTCKFLIIINT